MQATSRVRLSVAVSLDTDNQWYYVAPSGHVFLVQYVQFDEYPLALNAEPDDLSVVRIDGMRCLDNGETTRMPVTGWAVHYADVPDYIREAARTERDEEARRLWRLWLHTNPRANARTMSREA